MMVKGKNGCERWIHGVEGGNESGWREGRPFCPAVTGWLSFWRIRIQIGRNGFSDFLLFFGG